MTEVNPDRGEDELVLAGEHYLLRPAHQALRAIERRTERSLLELVRMGNVGALTIDQLGAIAAELIRAGADGDITRQVDAGRMGELIQEDSIARATFRLTAVLASAVSGGRTVTGEAKAATA